MTIYEKNNKNLNEVIKMGEENKGNKPVGKKSSGAITVSRWNNKVEFKGEKRDMLSWSIQKRYKDGDDWKDSKSFNLTDLPKLISLLQQEFNETITKVKDDD